MCNNIIKASLWRHLVQNMVIFGCLCLPALIIFLILTLWDDSFSKYTYSQQDICLMLCNPFSHLLYFPAAQCELTKTHQNHLSFRCPQSLFRRIPQRWRTWHMLANFSNATRPRLVFQLVRSSTTVGVSKAVGDQNQNFPNPLQMTLSTRPETLPLTL